jgi:hypothetical protein
MSNYGSKAWMRIGKIRNIVNAVTDETDNIYIDEESLYEGQAYRIDNWPELVRALDLISEQPWNTMDYSPVSTLKEEYGDDWSIEITVAEYNSLSSYITSVNEKYPVFIATVRSFVEDQDEKVLNIRLPDRPRNLQELNEINARIDRLFRKFDANIEFLGFDKGSDWYVILVREVGKYSIIVGCLKVAQEFFKTRTEYFKSKSAELDYRASLQSAQNPSPGGLRGYKIKRMNLELEERIKEVVNEALDKRGRSAEELHTHLVNATKDLVKELGAGVEFHLSLNPPNFASEKNGKLSIDYKKIRELQQKQKSQPKQIKQPSQETN